jgi:hypothetical protein
VILPAIPPAIKDKNVNMKIRNKAAWKKEPAIVWIGGVIVLLIFLYIIWFSRSHFR